MCVCIYIYGGVYGRRGERGERYCYCCFSDVAVAATICSAADLVLGSLYLKCVLRENILLIAPSRLPLLLSGYLVNFRITKKINLSSIPTTSLHHVIHQNRHALHPPIISLTISYAVSAFIFFILLIVYSFYFLFIVSYNSQHGRFILHIKKKTPVDTSLKKNGKPFEQFTPILNVCRVFYYFGKFRFYREWYRTRFKDSK